MYVADILRDEIKIINAIRQISVNERLPGRSSLVRWFLVDWQAGVVVNSEPRHPPQRANAAVRLT